MAEIKTIDCRNLLNGCSGLVQNVSTNDTIPFELRNFHMIWSKPMQGFDYKDFSMAERDSIFPDSFLLGRPFETVFNNILCDTQYLHNFRAISDFHEKRDTSWHLFAAIGSDSDGLIFSIKDGEIFEVLKKSIDETSRFQY